MMSDEDCSQKTKGFLLAPATNPSQHLPPNLISDVLSASKLLQNYFYVFSYVLYTLLHLTVGTLLGRVSKLA